MLSSACTDSELKLILNLSSLADNDYLNID